MSTQYRIIPRPWGHECVFDDNGVCGSFVTRKDDNHMDMILAESAKIRAMKSAESAATVEKITTFDEDKKSVSAVIDSFISKYPTKEATDFLASNIVVDTQKTVVEVNEVG